ncbi:MAG: sulfite exporter TauE/SafE family protein [Chloroflexus sp.]|uniref:sulfite exporter TauE/SafE family protein n=1 Tax=Chloroflexus sp. TaxID=1904827 RepID=UPI00404B5139
MLEVLLGLLIAVSIGLPGVGGGTITTSVLILGLGIAPEVAVGTALLFALCAKIPAGLIYWQQQQVHPQTLVRLLAGGVPAVVIGSFLLHALKSYRDVVLVGIGLIVLVAAGINLFVTLIKVPSLFHLAPGWMIAGAGFIGLEVGFSSAGAGALGTLLLLNTTRLSLQAVVGTDLWFGLILSAIGGGIHTVLGQFDLWLFLKLTGGGVIGSLAGAWPTQHVSQRPFRLGLLVWMIGIGSHLVFRSLMR